MSLENTNKSIVLNSIILYTKLFINTITGLLTTRFALQALGINDFGLFSVIGSIISFIGIFNTIMVSTSNRFISIAIGKGNMENINIQFNVCLLIHVIIALATFIIVIPIGYFYIYNVLKYNGNLDSAMIVFCFTSIASIFSFVGVPYQGLLVAKENFFVFSLTDVVSHIVKLVVAYLLLFYFEDKLLIYAFFISILTVVPTIVNYVYCSRNYIDIIRFKLVKEKSCYKEVLVFSGWVSYGAIASVARSQGASIIINGFFNTAMNAALGLANSIGALLNMFANSIAQPIMPQITKSYAAGDHKRCDELLIMSTKYTFLVMFAIAIPFLAEMEWILTLWLGEVPNHVVCFSTLIIVDLLVLSLNSGVSNIIFASGKIKLYQLIINTLRLAAIVFSYLVLKFGGPANSLLYTYILFSVFIFFASQLILRKTLNYDSSILWRKSYFPSLISVIFMIPLILFPFLNNPLFNILLNELYFGIMILFFCLSRYERKRIGYIFMKLIFKSN